MSDNKNIEAVWYHRRSGAVAGVILGKFYPSGCRTSASCDGKVDDHYEETVSLFSPTKGIKQIFNDRPWEDASRFGTVVGKLGFSPDGRYIDLKLWGWEWATQLIIDTNENRDILSDSIIETGNIYWSPDGNVLSMRSYSYGFDGSGIDGIFVSEHGRPENLREVFTWGEEERAGESKIDNVRYLSNDHLQFSVQLKRCHYEGDIWVCGSETARKFIYFVKARQLREL